MFIFSKNKQETFTIIFGIIISLFSSIAIADLDRGELLKVANLKASGEYVRKSFLKNLKKPFQPKGKKKALIIGDSHAQDFLNGVLENGYLKDYQISTRYIPTRCQIFLGESKMRSIAPKDKTLCSNSDDLREARKQIKDADLIILAASWREWAAKVLPQSIKNLNLSSQQKLLVIGRKNFGRISIRRYLRMPEKELLKIRNKVDIHQNKINEIMKKALDESLFVDLHGLVCGTSSASCPIFTTDLKLISFDGAHLTPNGARYIGEILFKTPLLKNL